MNEDGLDTQLVKYAKVRQGLTLDGMRAHIANAIILWNLGKDNDNKWRGTQNDCQLVLNWVLRSYHQKMLRDNLYGKIHSTQDGHKALQNGTGYHLEHAIPVACIMWALFNEVQSRTLPEAIEQVRAVIDNTMKVAYVSHKEHGDLNTVYSCTMPKDYEKYPWTGDAVWARYVASGVPKPEVR